MNILIGNHLRICQLNIEKISKPKCEVLARLAYEKDIHVILLQETATRNEADMSRRGEIAGFNMVAAIHSAAYGIATYIKSSIDDYEILEELVNQDTFIITINIQGLKIVNVYKPPSIIFTNSTLTFHEHPCLYMGDFNSHHTNWGYSNTDQNGEMLYNSMLCNNFDLVFNAKDRNTFHSAVWHTETNPDIVFVSKTLAESNGVKREVMSNFPNTQHRPTLITVGFSIVSLFMP